MTFTYRYRKQILITGCCLLLFITIGYFLFFYSNTEVKAKKGIQVAKKESQKKISEEKTDVDMNYKVDIKGQIISPGIYSVAKDSRVMDVISLAGGLTENADTSVINLSKKVVDEMVIIVYSRFEVENFKQVKEEEKIVQENCIQGGNYDLKNDACITDSSESKENLSSKISINTATKEELMMLSGVGEAKANAIISYREEHGAFEKIEDIKNVSGIGDHLFAQIQENITT